MLLIAPAAGLGVSRLGLAGVALLLVPRRLARLVLLPRALVRLASGPPIASRRLGSLVISRLVAGLTLLPGLVLGLVRAGLTIALPVAGRRWFVPGLTGLASGPGLVTRLRLRSLGSIGRGGLLIALLTALRIARLLIPSLIARPAIGLIRLCLIARPILGSVGSLRRLLPVRSGLIRVA